jgi:hypothetical protein
MYVWLEDDKTDMPSVSYFLFESANNTEVVAVL